MSESCDKVCDSCGEDCKDRTQEKKCFLENPHELSNIKKVIGVVSGKGGVGKSLVTSMLAVLTNRKGYKTAILDADITGPSIPMAFGIHEKARGTKEGLLPIKSKTGIEIMSLNLLLDKDTDPVVWRGPIISSTVKQFWTDVIWEDIDFMFIDMPPGTGDVSLTVFQSLPVDGIIIVTSPQELVSMIVTKAVNMANLMKVPILGIVENMSYVMCPNCNKEIKVFGDSHIEQLAKDNNIKMYAKMPMNPVIAAACDNGEIESFEGDWLDNIASFLENKGGINMKIAVASEGNKVTGHFGHCENFNIYLSENNKIVSSESIPNPGHKPGFLPNFLNDLGVNVIISGGMGGGAVEIFNEKNIEVVVGATGDAEAAAKMYLNGELQSTGSICHEHEHEGDC